MVRTKSDLLGTTAVAKKKKKTTKKLRKNYMNQLCYRQHSLNIQISVNYHYQGITLNLQLIPKYGNIENLAY